MLRHLHHTYIHPGTHSLTHTWVTCEIHAHVHVATVYYDPSQLTNSIYKTKDKAHRAHGQKEIMHAYGPKSTPTAQGLVDDINTMYAYWHNSSFIAQRLLYDINALHSFWLRESKRTCGSVSTPIAQGLVEMINAKGEKMVMSPKTQGFVNNTHHGKKCMLKYCTHDSMNSGKGATRTNSGSAGKKTTYSDETNHINNK